MSEGLKAVARSQQIPLKSVLLAVHLKVLGMLASQTDVVTGVVTHGRPEGRDGERALGLFLNTVPFRESVASGSWAQLARQTFESELELMPYRYYQMAQIQRDLGGQPLFETVFNFTNFHVFQKLNDIPDLEVLDSSLYAETNLAFWANFSTDPSTSNVQLTLSADAKMLSTRQSHDFAGYYSKALALMAFDSDREHSDCDLMSEKERRQLLVDWNMTAVEYPQEPGIAQLFERQVVRTPNAIALVSSGEALTFVELNQRANRLARHLRSLGVKAESRVGVCLERSTDLVVALLAVLKSSGAYVPMDAAYPLERLNFMLNDARCSLLITHDSL